MPTVSEVARELGLTSDQVLRRVRAYGTRVQGDSSSIDERAAERLRSEIGSFRSYSNSHRPTGQEPSPPPPATEAPARSPGSEAGGLPEASDGGSGMPADSPVSGAASSPSEAAPPGQSSSLSAFARPATAPAPEGVFSKASDNGHGPQESSGPGTPIIYSMTPAEESASDDYGMGLPDRSEPQDKEGRAARRRESEEGKKKKGVVAQILELPLLIIFAFLIAVLIKTFLVQAFFIPSASMFPTLRVGDRVLVEKVSYLFDSPSRKDVIVFARSALPGRQPDLPWTQDAQNFLRELLGLPTEGEEDFIKRIVAVGGDTIAYTGKPHRLIINGEEVQEPYIKGAEDSSSTELTARDCTRLRMGRAEGGCVVPEGEVFVMGDNRANSEDSRFVGPIDEDEIVGKAFVVLWPLEDFQGL
jgi:signal peptidase I